MGCVSCLHLDAELEKRCTRGFIYVQTLILLFLLFLVVDIVPWDKAYWDPNFWVIVKKKHSTTLDPLQKSFGRSDFFLHTEKHDVTSV